MRYLTLGLAAALFALPLQSFAADATPKTLSDADRANIEAVIKDYIVNKHPEIIKEAIEELQRREQADADAKSKAAMAESKAQIYNDPNTPVGGDPKGDVTVVEFFDYQCGYCKMAEPSIEKLLKEDGHVRMIYKDFPILGPVSSIAAHAALASVKQGKYLAFHDALLAKKDHLAEETIYEVAGTVGLDVAKLKKDMADQAIDKQVNANLKLGEDIGARGTPLFIIGDQTFPGAIPYDQMVKAVKDARDAAKK